MLPRTGAIMKRSFIGSLDIFRAAVVGALYSIRLHGPLF